MTRARGKQHEEPAKATRRRQYAAVMALIEDVMRAQPQGGGDVDEARLDELLERARACAPALDVDRAWIVRACERVAARPRPRTRTRTRTRAEWSAIFPRYPTDEQGFALSFEAHEQQAIRAALDRLGVVVVRALAPATCAATVRAMFEEINGMPTALARGGRRREAPVRPRAPIQPERPETWETSNWPSASKFLIPRPAFHPQAFANRVDAALHGLFATIWGDARLRVTIDNWGVVRGTRGLALPTSSGGWARQDRPEWDAAIGPHWDYNPWLWLDERRGGREPGYQGLVALVDQPPGSGCHRTLPGCTRFLERWCRERERPSRLGMKRASHRPERDDPIVAWMQELPLRAGHMVIWSWGQLHGSAPNHTDQLRLHQYIRMFPAAEVDDFYERHDRYAPARVLAQHAEGRDRSALAALELDARARRLLGLERWPT